MARELCSLCFLLVDMLAPLRRSLQHTHLSKWRVQVSFPVPSGVRPHQFDITRAPALNHAPRRPRDQRLTFPHPCIQNARRLQNTQAFLHLSPPPPPLLPPPPPPLPPRPLRHVLGDPSQLITHCHHQSRAAVVLTVCRCYHLWQGQVRQLPRISHTRLRPHQALL